MINWDIIFEKKKFLYSGQKNLTYVEHDPTNLKKLKKPPSTPLLYTNKK